MLCVDRFGITVPCADEIDERERAMTDSPASLYGEVYSDLLDEVENRLVEILDRSENGAWYITDIFNGFEDEDDDYIIRSEE